MISTSWKHAAFLYAKNDEKGDVYNADSFSAG